MSTNLNEWFAKHKTEALAGAGGLVLALALYAKSKSSSASSSTGATTGTSTLYPPAVANTTGTDTYTGLENQILGLQQGLLSLQNPSQAGWSPTGQPAQPMNPTTGKPEPFPAQPAPSPSPGWPNQADLGGQTWDVLGGFNASGQYVGSNLLNGAPVAWTWTGQGTPEVGALPPAGAGGVVAYTPSSTPLADIAAGGSPYVPPYSQGYTGPVG